MPPFPPITLTLSHDEQRVLLIALLAFLQQPNDRSDTDTLREIVQRIRAKRY